MKKFFFILALFVSQYFYCGDIFQYKLEKNQKLEGTFSGEIAIGSTIHLVLIKNSDTKKYEIMPFVVDKTNVAKKLDAFIYDEKLDILSYHSNNETLTIICFDENNETLITVDYNLISGKNTSKNEALKKAPDNVFRLESKTILVAFDTKNHALKAKIITDAKTISDKQFDINDEQYQFFKHLISEKPEVVNQQEFVVNGSISKRKAYFLNNHLVYTFEEMKDEIQFFDFDLQKEKAIKQNLFNLDFTKKNKDLSNYFYDNKLIFLSVKKEDLEINILDATTKNQIKKLSIINDLTGYFTPEALKEFITEASKTYKKSTITINKTKDNKLAFRLDCVEKATYAYNDFWFLHQMMWNQQMMMQQNFRPPMGPAQTDDLALFFTEKEKPKPLEFILDADFKVFKGISDIFYPKIDKETVLEKYKEDKTKKEFTASFTDTEIRYIYQDKKSKTINIAFDKL